MLKLKRLRIDSYRNVKPGTELHFDDGVNLILGTNGSGKTTLLGLLAAVCGLRFSELEQEEFALEFEVRGEDVRWTVHIESRASTPDGRAAPQIYRIEARLDDRSYCVEGSPGRYRKLAPVAEDSFTELEIQGDFTVLYHLLKAKQHWSREAFRELKALGLEMKARTGPEEQRERTEASLAEIDARLKKREHALDRMDASFDDFFTGSFFRFDEGLSTFYAVTGQQAPSAGNAGPHPLESLLVFTRDEKQNLGLGKSPRSPSKLSLPYRFLTGLVSPAADGTLRELIPSAELPFLAKACELLGFARATLHPNIASTQRGKDGELKVRLTGLEFRFYRADGTFLHHDLLSYGQKRLLAFLLYLAAYQDFIVADELVNGLHHRWIAACMEAIGDRQAFLTSQNPLLFEHVEFDSVEQVQARFITCKTELVDGAEQMIWQNMPRADAEIFYKAYRAEVEHVGDILISRGLW